MSLYKCLYLLPEEQYRRSAVGGTNVVEGIGGSVSDSHVNKIEVNHGGSVVIDKHSNCGGKAAAATGGQPGVSPRPASVEKLPPLSVQTPPRKRSTKNNSRLGGTKGELAAKSTKLTKGRKAPNAVARFKRAGNVPSRQVRTRRNASGRVAGKDGDDLSKDVFRSIATNRDQWRDEEVEEPMEVDQLVDPRAVPARPTARQLEKVIARKHANRSQKEKEKMLLDSLKVAKVKELQGTRGKRESMNDRQQEREIVHQLRDIYRDELKKGAARQKSGPRTVLDSDDLREDEIGGSGGTGDGSKKRRKIGDGKSLAPSLALSALENGMTQTLEAATATPHGVKRPPGEDWPSSATKRQKALPKPWLIRQKRPPSPSWDVSSGKKVKSPPEPWRIREKRPARDEWPAGDRKRSKGPSKPWQIREKRSARDEWPAGDRKRLKGLPDPWAIREKRSAPSTWSGSQRKRKKREEDTDDSSSSSDSDGDSSDDGNGGKYKSYLDSIASRKKNVARRSVK